METKNKIVVTSDGSNTLFSEHFGETYHSTHGAVQESMHIFINACLHYLAEKEKRVLNIFEFGFGTGLNAILAYRYAQENNIRLNYRCIEAFPISLTEAAQLNYGEILNDDTYRNVYMSMHEVAPGEALVVSDNFTFTKYISNIRYFNFSLIENTDAVFYDAFSPDAQPELWTKELFEKIYAQMSMDGTLTTYCAKGQVKRNLKEAGFNIESLDGPPGKREITRALKSKKACNSSLQKVEQLLRP